MVIVALRMQPSQRQHMRKPRCLVCLKVPVCLSADSHIEANVMQACCRGPSKRKMDRALALASFIFLYGRLVSQISMKLSRSSIQAQHSTCDYYPPNRALAFSVISSTYHSCRPNPHGQQHILQRGRKPARPDERPRSLHRPRRSERC